MFVTITIVIIFLFVCMTYYGIDGGRWLWRKLASTDILKSKMSNIVKTVGVFSLAIFLMFIVSGLYIFFAGDLDSINFIVTNGTKMMYFATMYNIGYLYSIRRPNTKGKQQRTEEKPNSGDKPKFHLKKVSIKQGILVLGTFLGISIPILIILELTETITADTFNALIFYFLLGSIGLVLGWIFWEHLKESSIIVGEFHKTLWILSLIFEIPVAALTFIGIISEISQYTYMNPYILVGYLLLFQLMWAYFLGLMIETVKKNNTGIVK